MIAEDIPREAHGLLCYVDCEYSLYSGKWNFENGGVRYRSRTPASEAYLENVKA